MGLRDRRDEGMNFEQGRRGANGTSLVGGGGGGGGSH